MAGWPGLGAQAQTRKRKKQQIHTMKPLNCMIALAANFPSVTMLLRISYFPSRETPDCYTAGGFPSRPKIASKNPMTPKPISHKLLVSVPVPAPPEALISSG